MNSVSRPASNVCRRLLVHSLGGEGYLNFEGNEFGHPEVSLWLFTLNLILTFSAVA